LKYTGAAKRLTRMPHVWLMQPLHHVVNVIPPPIKFSSLVALVMQFACWCYISILCYVCTLILRNCLRPFIYALIVGVMLFLSLML